MFGRGRLHLVRGQPSAAIEYYEKAMKAQNQYRNLHHISFWEMAIANLALWDVPASLEYWRILAAEATVRPLFHLHNSSIAAARMSCSPTRLYRASTFVVNALLPLVHFCPRWPCRRTCMALEDEYVANVWRPPGSYSGRSRRIRTALQCACCRSAVRSTRRRLPSSWRRSQRYENVSPASPFPSR